MHRTRIYIVTLLLSLTATCFGQAGRSVFAFMELPYSARHNALGGTNVSLGSEGELGMALNNPALLSGDTHMQLQMNYAYYGAAMNFASVAYGHNWGHNYTGYAIHYLDYGKMEYADEYGNLQGGTFSARDMVIDLMYARQLHPLWRIGVALKPVYSHYETYGSFAMGADVGGYFALPDSSLQIGLSLQNIGWQLRGFYSKESGQALAMLPLNLQLGLTYKLPHAPLRFHLTIHNMQTWKLDYGMQTESAIKWYDTLFRHTVWAVDIVPKKDVFWATISYNHRRHAELSLKDQRSLAGLAIGAGINIKMVRAGFAFSQYTKSNYTYQFTLSLDINQLK